MVNYKSGCLCHAAPKVQLRNVFKYWAGATCPSVLPTMAVDNDVQLLEVETLQGDGTFSPTGRLRAEAAGTPGPLWNTTPSITTLTAVTLHLVTIPK